MQTYIQLLIRVALLEIQQQLILQVAGKLTENAQKLMEENEKLRKHNENLIKKQNLHRIVARRLVQRMEENEAKNRRQPDSKIFNTQCESLWMHDIYLKFRNEGFGKIESREKAADAACKDGITRREVAPNEYKSVPLKEATLHNRFIKLGRKVPLEGDYAEHFKPINDEQRKAGRKLLEELRAANKK